MAAVARVVAVPTSLAADLAEILKTAEQRATHGLNHISQFLQDLRFHLCPAVMAVASTASPAPTAAEAGEEEPVLGMVVTAGTEDGSPRRRVNRVVSVQVEAVVVVKVKQMHRA